MHLLGVGNMTIGYKYTVREYYEIILSIIMLPFNISDCIKPLLLMLQKAALLDLNLLH